MPTIIKFKLGNLHNDEWDSFCSSFKHTVEEYGPQPLGVDKLFSRFLTRYHLANDQMDIPRKSYLTQIIIDLHRERQKLFRTLYAITKANLHFKDEEKYEAAYSVFLALRQFKHMILKSTYNEASGALTVLLDMLEEKFAADITLLNMDVWVTSLRTTEDQYVKAYWDRNTESAHKPQNQLSQLRPEIDRLYNLMIGIIDAKLATDPTAQPVADFANLWNEKVKKYRNTLAVRKGRHDAKQQADSFQ